MLSLKARRSRGLILKEFRKLMKITILDPEAQELPEEAFGSNMLLLTNPVEQKIFIPARFAGKQVVEDDFLNPAEYEAVNQKAKTWARTWFEIPEIRQDLMFNGLNLGAFVSRDLAYRWVAVLKAVWLFDEVFKQVKPDEVVIAGDPESLWSVVAREITAQHGLSATLIKTKKKKTPLGHFYKRNMTDFIKKTLVSFLSPLRFSGFSQGKIIFSSALKFALPFFEMEKGNYYLREVFSFKAFQNQKKLGFHHLYPPVLPDLVCIDSEKIFSKLSRVLNGEFQFKGYSSWGFLCGYFRTLTHTVFPRACHLINWMEQLLEQTNPCAVVTDEEVCFFNQILVQAANKKKIPTMVLLHGMPFDDIGTCPSHSQKILAWGESSASQLEEWGIPRSKIECVGAPQYNHFKAIDHAKSREMVFREFLIPQDHSLVMYASQPFHTNRNADFLGNSMSAATLTQMIGTLMAFIKNKPKVTLIIKAHPREDKLWFTRKLIESSGVCDSKQVLLLTDYDTNRLLAAADLLITMGSTVFFEAFLLKKAVLFFDSAKRRYFPKMGKDFLDLDSPDTSIQRIQELLIPSRCEAQLRLQEAKVTTHFAERNQNPVMRALRVIHALN